MSTMLAARIFAYVGMQSYSMTVFISGERYSEIGLELIWRDWSWKQFWIFFKKQASMKNQVGLTNLSKVSILMQYDLILDTLWMI